MNNEIWLPCPGWERIYAVSNRGHVKRVVPGVGKARVGHILRPGKNPKGYQSLLLCEGGNSSTRYIHRLVCETFHGPPPTPRHQAAHKDDDKLNNTADNLYWATPLENGGRDRRRNGRITQGAKIGRAKLTDTDVIEIRRLRNLGMLCREIGAKFGVAEHTVSRICSGVRWGHLVP